MSLPNLGEMEFGYRDSDIGAVIDVGQYMCAKIAALAAHATQVALAPDRRSVLVSNNFVQPDSDQRALHPRSGCPRAT